MNLKPFNFDAGLLWSLIIKAVRSKVTIPEFINSKCTRLNPWKLTMLQKLSNYHVHTLLRAVLLFIITISHDGFDSVLNTGKSRHAKPSVNIAKLFPSSARATISWLGNKILNNPSPILLLLVLFCSPDTSLKRSLKFYYQRSIYHLYFWRLDFVILKQRILSNSKGNDVSDRLRLFICWSSFYNVFGFNRAANFGYSCLYVNACTNYVHCCAIDGISNQPIQLLIFHSDSDITIDLWHHLFQRVTYLCKFLMKNLCKKLLYPYRMLLSFHCWFYYWQWFLN